ncbi:neuromedin U [Lentimicrobium sp. S6]|uniref:neuromedin U n=1 Tax=Lentimicrobium sp. S6 TaxID=2735872 RepID=UPI001556BC05|nr:neuromedin U [Lentimicrobium sp. S6]NPD44251.1 neuromedin U [Lentimicrobium sp. S6]
MKKLLLLSLSIILGIFSVNAQESLEHIEHDSTLQELGNESMEDLSSAAANPLANLMSFPFQNNLNMNYGEHNRNTNILNIQPVVPLFGGKLITRTIFPIVRIPDFSNESGKLSSGLADIVFTAFYVPESKGVMVGFGPVIELPTGGSIRGSQKWSAGPSFVALITPGDWTIGALINNAWSFAGNSDRDDVNHMLINIFAVRQLGKGWYVNSAPIITADWTADTEDQWIVPLGGGGGKMVMLGGKLPLNLQSQLYYNVVRPDFGPEWQWRVQAQFLLPMNMFSKK